MSTTHKTRQLIWCHQYSQGVALQRNSQVIQGHRKWKHVHFPKTSYGSFHITNLVLLQLFNVVLGVAQLRDQLRFLCRVQLLWAEKQSTLTSPIFLTQSSQHPCQFSNREQSSEAIIRALRHPQWLIHKLNGGTARGETSSTDKLTKITVQPGSSMF